MRGRNFASVTNGTARLQISPFGRSLREIQSNFANTCAVALIGLLLSGPVMAEKNALIGGSNAEPNLSRNPVGQGRSDTQDLQTTERASKSVGQTEVGLVGIDSSILPLLVDSPERWQLAKDLEFLLRQGKIEEAENRLNTAINIGTFAILLFDQLRRPSFLAELQALGIRDDNQSTALAAAATKPVLPPANSTDMAHAAPTSAERAELRVAGDGEQQRADVTSHDFAAVVEELHALQALRAQDAASALVSVKQQVELKASFETERDRADAITRDLTAMAEERRVLQKLRGQDAILIESNRRELQEIKGKLEGERQRNQAAAAARQKGDQLATSKGSGPPSEGVASTSRAPVLSANSPGSLPVPVAAVVQTNTSQLRGVPNVISTSTLSLQGRTIHLFGVQTDDDAKRANELTQYLDNREVVCEPAGGVDVYRCQVDRKDLSVVVLFNGGGWAVPDAPRELLIAADRARLARVGVWSR